MPKDNKPRPFPTTNHKTAASLTERESTRVLIGQKSITCNSLKVRKVPHETLSECCNKLHLLQFLFHSFSNLVLFNINLLLTEREGRTGEYWPEVVAVRKRQRANIPLYGSSKLG